MVRNLVLGALALGLALTGCGGTAPEAPSQPPAAQTAAPEASILPGTLFIPRLGVSRALEPLGIDASNHHQVPAEPEGVGWFTMGPEPGEPGAAIILAHVNLHGRAGVFARLRELQAGDEVSVDDHRFQVTEVQQVSKNAFPADRVYVESPTPELRLITCGGAFDGEHYKDNIIVYAKEV